MTEPPTSHRHGHPHPHGRLRSGDPRSDQPPKLTLHRPRGNRPTRGTHRGTQRPIRTPLTTHLHWHVTGLPTPILGSHRHPPFSSRCCDNQLNPPRSPLSESVTYPCRPSALLKSWWPPCSPNDEWACVVFAVLCRSPMRRCCSSSSWA